MTGMVNGLMHPPVMKLYPAYEDFYYETAGSYTFTVPRGAKRMDVTVIGGGAGGMAGGVSYGNIENAYPGGGAGGAAGNMQHVKKASAKPGTQYAVTVGAGGAANGGNGGKSTMGTMAGASGGNAGTKGGNEPLSNTGTANGGTGGNGGIGGNGGGPGRGQYATLLGKSGANGTDALDWEGWELAEWYVFRDETTGKRLGQGGQGGYGYDLGSYGEQNARGLSAQQAAGTMYGSGGRGGDQQKTGSIKTPEAGKDGLVAIRIYYK